jgi:hypothetical protein
MKKFIEKLIAKLEEKKSEAENEMHRLRSENYTLLCRFDRSDIEENTSESFKESIEIVKQLEEEMNLSENLTSSDGWIACSERLPEANQKVLTCDKDGWISVNVNMPYIGVRNDFECGYYVAWMPLPAPYKEGVTENE